MDVVANKAAAGGISAGVAPADFLRNPGQIADTAVLLGAILQAEAAGFIERAVGRFECAARAIGRDAARGSVLAQALEDLVSSSLIQLVEDWWNDLGAPAIAHFQRLNSGPAGRLVNDRLISVQRDEVRRLRSRPHVRSSWFRGTVLANAKTRFAGEADRIVSGLTEIVVDYLREQAIAGVTSTAPRERPRTVTYEEASPAFEISPCARRTLLDVA
jgi:hypothetical protein